MMKVLLLSLASMLVGSATAAADLVRYDESPREYPRIVQGQDPVCWINGVPTSEGWTREDGKTCKRDGRTQKLKWL